MCFLKITLFSAGKGTWIAGLGRVRILDVNTRF